MYARMTDVEIMLETRLLRRRRRLEERARVLSGRLSDSARTTCCPGGDTGDMGDTALKSLKTGDQNRSAAVPMRDKGDGDRWGQPACPQCLHSLHYLWGHSSSGGDVLDSVSSEGRPRCPRRPHRERWRIGLPHRPTPGFTSRAVRRRIVKRAADSRTRQQAASISI
jgi:hypothetical protein